MCIYIYIHRFFPTFPANATPTFANYQMISCVKWLTGLNPTLSWLRNLMTKNGLYHPYTPLQTNIYAWKMMGWKTILSFWAGSKLQGSTNSFTFSRGNGPHPRLPGHVGPSSHTRHPWIHARTVSECLGEGFFSLSTPPKSWHFLTQKLGYFQVPCEFSGAKIFEWRFWLGKKMVFHRVTYVCLGCRR